MYGTGTILKKQYLLENSVLDPDPHESALILLSWIRIRTLLGMRIRIQEIYQN